ncbi:MAG: uracil-DNA glycosylase [Candidatus Bipolaricaulaceae bacterium]
MGPGGRPVTAQDRLDRLAGVVVDCRRCPRLVTHRQQVARTRRAAFRHQPYWGRPVPGFGDHSARLLIVGLAPAAHGANRTGRMFTGDGPRGAGDFLMAALHRWGLANQPRSEHPDDGLKLTGVYLSAVVRCVPPGNRPTGDEVANCLPYLVKELVALSEIGAILALGRVAFQGCLAALEQNGISLPRPRPPFAHGAVWQPGSPGPTLLASYHPSRQNTQTGRLTPTMLDQVIARAKKEGGL